MANREARLRAPSGLESSGQIQWAAVAAAHEIATKNSKSFIMERVRGVEPLSDSWQESIMPLYDTRKI